MSSIHVIYNGRNDDIGMEQLFTEDRREVIGLAEGTALVASNLVEGQIKQALALYYDVGVGEFGDHFVEINPNGNITVRPSTPFGS